MIPTRLGCAACSSGTAQKAGWDKPLPKGRGRGIAAFASFGSYFAEVAEVTVKGSSFKIDRMVAAVDCGQIVNPESVRSQTEGAIIFGLSAGLKIRLPPSNGVVEQMSLTATRHRLSVTEAPPVEVYMVESKEDPGGMGEPALPPAAPAVANAIFAASGQRLRKMPFQLQTA